MERNDYDKIVVGDIVYLFILDISYQHHINLGFAAELKKTGDDEFKVTQVINGKLLKVGDLVKIDDKNWRSRFRTSNLWAKAEEGIEWWNAKIRNAEDGLTSQYEKRKRGLTKRLIQV